MAVNDEGLGSPAMIDLGARCRRSCENDDDDDDDDDEDDDDDDDDEEEDDAGAFLLS